MSPDRRTPRNAGPSTRRSAGSYRPARGGSSGPGRATDRDERTTRRAASSSKPVQPRFTGRATILVLVLAVLAISYASSAKAYLQQRHQLDQVQREIAQRQADIASLERQKERWDDPAYVRQIARERFGYVGRGETSYVVLGQDGKPLKSESELGAPLSAGTAPSKTPWWESTWTSVQLAGDPPKTTPPPADEIDGSKEATQQ